MQQYNPDFSSSKIDKERRRSRQINLNYHMIDTENFIFIFLYFIESTITDHLQSSTMAECKLKTCFGKRKRMNTNSDVAPPDSVAKCSERPEPSGDEEWPDINIESSGLTASSDAYSSDEDEKEGSYLDSKPAAVNKISTGSSASPFLKLGSDVMVAVVSFLDPIETLDLLTAPMCKEWRRSYTADQELWRTACCTEPFCADSSFFSLNDFKDDFDNKHALGEYRLVYTSFVRCMKYLDRVQNNETSDDSKSSSAKASDQSDHTNGFPTFGVTKSLKLFLSRSKERGIFKSAIGNGDISSAPIGVSTDGQEIVKDTLSKKVVKKEDTQKPKYGHSMITSRLWGPTATGVPSHLNLPKPCAIYSIVNWMVAHPNVRGIQTMCIKSLPSLLEDEQQRITGRRVGLVEVILCAMMRFPDSIELHIAVFHAIVLLARPLGGREGMLFDNSMAETTQSIGLTSLIELSDSVSLAARCGGLPRLPSKTSNQNTSGATASDDSSTNVTNEKGKTGISIMVDSMDRFLSSEKLQSMACWALVNVALVPLQKNMLMKIGGIEAILSAMENHSTSFDVQFRALFALINLSVPCRQSDFVLDPGIDAADATRIEKAVLNKLGAKIAKLSVSAMKNFCSSNAILNRGCLVVHNLSQSPEFIPTLLATPKCYEILEFCVTNHSTDRVLRRSVRSTLQRMKYYLDRHPAEQRRLSIYLEQQQNREEIEQFY